MVNVARYKIWLQQLQTGSKSERLQAAKELAASNYPNTLDCLIDYMQCYPGESAWAGEQIARMGSRMVSPLLELAQHHPSVIVRIECSEALSTFTDRRALYALEGIATSDPIRRVRLTATRALPRMGAGALDALLRLLHDADAHIRHTAALSLGQLGDAVAIEPLLQALATDHSRARAGIAIALGKLQATQAVEALIDIIQSDTPNGIRLLAIQALGRIGDPRAIVPIMSVMGASEDLPISKNAAQSLSSFGTTAIPPLIHILQTNPDPGQRISTLTVLGKIGHRMPFEAVSRVVLEDPDPRVGAKALRTLPQLGQVSPQSLSLLLHNGLPLDIRQAAAQVIAQVATEDDLPLLHTIFHETTDAHILRPLVSVLRDFANPESREVFRHILQEDRDASIRGCAATGLARIGGEEDLEMLINIVRDDDDDYTRLLACEGLVSMGDERAFPMLAQIASNPTYSELRASAMKGIKTLHPQRAVPVLAALLGKNEQASFFTVDELARNLLLEIGTPEALDALHAFDVES